MAALTLPFVLFVALPPLALLPGAVLWWQRQRRRGGLRGRDAFFATAAPVAWGLYALWECGMWVWSRDVVAPIRIDLLLVAPALYLLTLAAIAAFWNAARRAS